MDVDKIGHASQNVRHARRTALDPNYNARDEYGCCYTFWVLTVWPKIKSCMRRIRSCLCSCIGLDNRNVERTETPPYVPRSGAGARQPHLRDVHRPESFSQYPAGDSEEMLREHRTQYYSNHPLRLTPDERHLIDFVKPHAEQLNDNALLLAIAVLERINGAANDDLILELQALITGNQQLEQRANGLIAVLENDDRDHQRQQAIDILSKAEQDIRELQSLTLNAEGNSIDNGITPAPTTPSYPTAPSAPSIEADPEPPAVAFATELHAERFPHDEEIQQYIDEMQQFSQDPYINLALSILIGDENAIDLQLVRIQDTGAYIKAIEYSQGDAETLLVAATHSTDKATQRQTALDFLKDCQALHEVTQASKRDQHAAEAGAPETTHVVDVHRPQSEGSSTPEEEAASSQPTSLEDDDEKSMPIPDTFNPDENKNTIYKKTKRFLNKIQVNDEKITAEITDNYFDLQINTARNHRREAQLQAKSLRQRLLEITQGQYADETNRFIGDLMRTTSLDFQHQLRVSLLHEVDLVLRGADDENTPNTAKENKESETLVPPEAPIGETDEAAETSEASLSFHAPLPDLIERSLNRLGANMYPFDRARIYQLMVIGFIPEYVIKAIAEAGDISIYPRIIEDYLSLAKE